MVAASKRAQTKTELVMALAIDYLLNFFQQIIAFPHHKVPRNLKCPTVTLDGHHAAPAGPRATPPGLLRPRHLYDVSIESAARPYPYAPNQAFFKVH
eukprot:176757-Amorphochlora_amoeboformis.AAC.1